MSHPIPFSKRNLFILGGCIFAIYLLIASYTRFHVALNDFWGVYGYASLMDLSDFSTLRNSLFPVGYAGFIRLLSFGNASLNAIIANLLFATLTLTLCARYLSSYIDKSLALLAIGTIAIVPKYWTFTLVPSGDIGLVLFTAVAFMRLCQPELANKRNRYFLITGLILGIASLWRSHGLIIAILMCGIVIVISTPSWKKSLSLIGGILLLYSIQMLVNRLAGDGALATSRLYDIYKLMYGIDWATLDPNGVPQTTSSILAEVINNPTLFIANYFRSTNDLAPYLLFPPLAILATPHLTKQIHLKIGLFMVFYTLIIGLGDSPRGPLPLIPLAGIELGFALFGFKNAVVNAYQQRRIAGLSLALMGVLSFGYFAAQALYLDANRVVFMHNRDATFRNIEAALINAGATHPKEVFSTDPDLYFPTLVQDQLYVSGGWLRFSYPPYEKAFPTPDLTSIEAFTASSADNGVVLLLLNPNPGAVSRRYSQLFAEDGFNTHWVHVETVDGYTIYQRQ